MVMATVFFRTVKAAQIPQAYVVLGVCQNQKDISSVVTLNLQDGKVIL